MRFLRVLIIMAAGSALAPFAALAGSMPEPSPTGTPGATESPTPVPLMNVSLGTDRITWEAVPDAAVYEVKGTVTVLRVNAADPLCSQPLVQENVVLELDEEVAAPATEFVLPLAPLPPEDKWIAFHYQGTSVVALDARGNVLASVLTGLIAETFCPQPTVTPSPTVAPIVPPQTGDGGRAGAVPPHVAGLMLLLASGAMLIAAGLAARGSRA